MKKEANQEFGVIRQTYFTEKYDETCQFYKDHLGLDIGHSWDRGEQDKGTLFNVGAGLIEVLLKPDKELHNKGLDYRASQGVFMCFQVWNINERFEQYRAIDIPFKQEIVDQPWGHRSFSIVEPNGLVLFFYQEQF